MSSDEQILEVQRQTWASCADGWDTWDAVIRAQLGPVGDAMIGALDLAEGQQHLDIACGTGEPGLTVARLAPRGRVVLTDLSPEMLDVARRRAEREGLVAVETTVCSADDLPFDDGTFDSVSVRFGYMFFPDLARATAEFVRVLRPGGRLCASVWTQPEANPWTSVAMQAISTEVDPGAPGMYRCSEPGCISALYQSAGLVGLREWNVEIELVTRSATEYWDVVSEHVSAAVMALQHVDADARRRIAALAVDAAQSYEKDGQIRVPGLARCITGRKPG